MLHGLALFTLFPEIVLLVALDGSQQPGATVVVKRGGKLIHSYSVCAYFGEEGFRGMDLLSPVWNYFDLTPDGRGDFFPSKRYAE